MSRKVWSFVNKYLQKDDLNVYSNHNRVSKFRTENVKDGIKVTYRCSSCRKYPECSFQVRALFNSQNEIIVSTSDTHNHKKRADTTRAPSPVRDIILKSVATRLTQAQVKRAVQNEYNGPVSTTQVTNLLKYHRSLTRPSMYSVDDFKQWCLQRAAIPPIQSLQDVFVSTYEIISCDNLFIFFTTKQLISVGALSRLLQVDATFKLNWNELPVLVFGCSDANRKFHPFGIALISSDESCDSYVKLFQSIKNTVFKVTGIQYEIDYLLSDGAKGITAAKNIEFPGAKRLMCWAHCIRKIREHRKMVASHKWADIDKDILSLQLAFNDQLFQKGAALLLSKWRQYTDLHAFCSYFEQQRLIELPYWSEGTALGVPSTNNGLESLNGKIKSQYTLRNRSSLSVFLPTIEQMLIEWSNKSIQTGFATFPTISVSQEREAWQWLQNIDKNSIFHWYGQSYIVPSSFTQMDTYTWLQQYHFMPWLTFDEFTRWLYSARLVSMPMMCSCKQNLKLYVCKHAVGFMIHLNLYVITDPAKLQVLGKRRGRPKKADKALSRS